jgi:hypothetical protein
MSFFAGGHDPTPTAAGASSNQAHELMKVRLDVDHCREY